MSLDMVAFFNTTLVPIGLMLIMFSMGLTLALRDFGMVVRQPVPVTAGFAAILIFLACPQPAFSQGGLFTGFDVPLSDPYGEVSIERPTGRELRPVVVYFPNAAWPNPSTCGPLPEAFEALDRAGIAVASLWMSGDTLGREVRSIEEGLRTIRQRARVYRLDLNRIALLGCGAGGHFAALVATNPDFMTRAGLQFAAITGTAIVDGAGFDLRAIAAEQAGSDAGSSGRSDYFRGSTENLDAYSVAAHLPLPNTPSLLMVDFSAPGEQAGAAAAFGRQLQSTGTELFVEHIPEKVNAPEDGSSEPAPDQSGATLVNYLIARLSAMPQSR